VTDLPQGWVETTLGNLGSYWNGRAFKKFEWRPEGEGRQIIRIQDLTGSNQNPNYFAGNADDRNTARAGDILISWAATLGVFEWRGPEAVINQHIFKMDSFINKRFHRYLLESVLDDLRRRSHGTGMVHVTRKVFDDTPVSLPPLAEQERIVAAIEEQFSRLEEAVRLIRSGLDRLPVIRQAVLGSVMPNPLPASWKLLTVEDVGTIGLGRQRSPRYHSGPNMRPYLRVANVHEDRIDLTDVKEMDFPPEQVGRYELRPGDVLLNEGQSPEFVGRPAMYRDEMPGACYTNSLIRFRPFDFVNGEYALLVFLRHLRFGRFQREAQITTNIAHMAAGRFKRVEFPVPPLDVQDAIIQDVRRRLSLLGAFEKELLNALARSGHLRRSILESAFSGRLVPQDPDDEPAAKLLARIAAKDAATTKPRRRQRA
jgi:restriction endonuclease S subunit